MMKNNHKNKPLNKPHLSPYRDFSSKTLKNVEITWVLTLFDEKFSGSRPIYNIYYNNYIIIKV
jgi:hypothetical protein